MLARERNGFVRLSEAMGGLADLGKSQEIFVRELAADNETSQRIALPDGPALVHRPVENFMQDGHGHLCGIRRCGGRARINRIRARLVPELRSPPTGSRGSWRRPPPPLELALPFGGVVSCDHAISDFFISGSPFAGHARDEPQRPVLGHVRPPGRTFLPDSPPRTGTSRPYRALQELVHDRRTVLGKARHRPRRSVATELFGRR